MIDWKYTETLVDQWLINQGLVRIGRNIRFQSGEIDWLGWEGSTLVIIEIKASKINPIFASNRVDKKKKKKLIGCLSEILQKEEFCEVSEVKIELVIVYWDKNKWNFERVPIDFQNLEDYAE